MGVIEAIVNNIGSLVILLVGFGCIIAFLEFLYKKDEPKKSFQYRKLLVDLYVAGKIRQYAKKDGISFADEEENLNKWKKDERLKDLTLDETIEELLQERISKESKNNFVKKEKEEKK